MSGLSHHLLIAILIVQFCLLVTIPIPFLNASDGAQRRDYLGTSDQHIILYNGVWTLQKLVDTYPTVFEVFNVQNSSDVAGNSSTGPANKANDENSKNVPLLMTNPLVIEKQASLKISDAQLLLESFPGKEVFPVRILVRGEVIIENSTIDSFRKDQNMADRNPLHPRPFIAAVDGGVIDIRNTTIKHLGFSLGGISSLAAVNYFGTENFEITNSTFEYNYHGFYSDNSSDFQVKGNIFYGNTGYGIDPHTGSRNLLIDSNRVSLSGKQGIICSFLCYNVTITNNIVEEGTEGIGLHWLTNSSKIQNNTIKNNQLFGIFIKNSSTSNIIEGNTVTNNGCNIGLFEGANGNTIIDNTVVDTFSSQTYCDNNYVYSDNSSKSNNIGRNILIIDNNSSNYGIKEESIRAMFAIEAQSFNASNCAQDCTTAPLDVAIHRNIEKVIEENPSLEVVQSEAISVSRMPAHRIVFLQTNDTDLTNNRIVEIYAFDEHSGMQYTIRFEADNHTYARNLLLLDKLIKSISLSS